MWWAQAVNGCLSVCNLKSNILWYFITGQDQICYIKIFRIEVQNFFKAEREEILIFIDFQNSFFAFLSEVQRNEPAALLKRN